MPPKGEAFGFLGFDLRRVRKRQGNGYFLLMTPKKKARKAIKAKVRDIIQHSGATPMPQVVKQINASLAGCRSPHEKSVSERTWRMFF